MSKILSIHAENKFAIDLLWVRVGKVGGTESFARNLIDGMRMTARDFNAVLLVAEDNQETFCKYTQDSRFQLVCCPVQSKNVKKRLLWQNLHLYHFLIARGIYKCFVPIYSIPFVKSNRIQYYAVIHDLQAYHFPEYFSKGRVAWMKISWRNTVKNACTVIAISEYTRQDLISTFHAEASKIKRIHNPIVVQEIEKNSAEQRIKNTGVESGKYFFCVTSLLAHKNVQTLIQMMKKRDDSYPLLICGVGGPMHEKLETEIRNERLDNRVCLLPFVDDMTRDALYHGCRIFLFPSIFEGFGMPPVEALLAGKPVITTRCTSIPEATRGEAVYVENPYDADEWNGKIDEELLHPAWDATKERTISPGHNPYSLKKIAEQYLDVIVGGEDADRD